MSTLSDKTDCPDDVVKTPDDPKRVYRSSEQTSLLNSIQDDLSYIILDLPNCLKGFNVTNCNEERDISLDSLELKVRSFPIPDIVLENEKIRYGVGSITNPIESLSDFDPITISFGLDDKLINYYTMYKWLNMVVDIEKGFGTQYDKGDYSSKFHAFILNQNNRVIGCFTFHNVVPQSLGGFNTDNTSTGEHIFVDVTFDYDYMTFDMRDGKRLKDTNF